MEQVLVYLLDPSELAGHEDEVAARIGALGHTDDGSPHLHLAARLLVNGVYGVASPEQLELGQFGKPALSQAAKSSLAKETPALQLADAAERGLLEFNLSLSPSAVVIACARSAVGVDVQELMDPDPIVIERYFPASLKQEFAESVDKGSAYYTECWTRLEAALKADGRGFVAPRKDFEGIYRSWNIKSRVFNSKSLEELNAVEAGDASTGGGFALSVALEDDFEFSIHPVTADMLM